MNKLDVIILAGGKGTRLRSAVPDMPKPMAHVAGKPFLDLLLSSLDRCDCVSRVVLAVGYRAEQVIRYYQDCTEYRFDIQFSIEKQLLGTGGAIKRSIALTDTPDVLVMNGDSFVDVDYHDLIRCHRDVNAAITIVLRSVLDTARYGTVQLAPDNRVLSFTEKQEGINEGLVNAGIYLLQRSVFETVEEDRILSIEKDLLPGFVLTLPGGVYGYIVQGRFIDIGLPESYYAAQQYLRC